MSTEPKILQHAVESSVSPENEEWQGAQENAERFPSQAIALGKGMVMHVESIAYAFTLPHRFHERLIYEVESKYTKPVILLNRRIGYLGSTNPVRYSLLAHRKHTSDFSVRVGGAALNNKEAWSFKALIPLKDLGIGIAKILEHVAALPIHAVVAQDARQSNTTIKSLSSFCDTS
ncbi:MAG: hypothetical protein AAF387_19540 [Pseudomonadota bacterium]